LTNPINPAQVANLYGGGADKLPMEGRAEFAEQYMEQILQTADDPLAPETTWCVLAFGLFRCS